MPNQSQKRNKRAKRPKPRRSGAGLQRRGNQYNYLSLSSPAYAPPFPKEFSVALRSNTVTTVAAVSATKRYPVPLLEYLSYDPLNLVQLYTMYEFSKVTAISVHYEISNYGTTPIVVSSGVLPYNQYLTINQADLSKAAGAKTKIVGGLVGKISLRQNFASEKYLGAVAQSSQYWIDASQSNSLVPISVEEPTHLLMIEATPGNNMSYTMAAIVTFHVQFFNPMINQL